MSQTRVYLPSTLTLLRDVIGSGGIGPPPVPGHAVTEALRNEYPDDGEEDWEYTALTAAAQDSLALLTEEDPPRRVVIVVDVASPAAFDPDEPSRVVLEEVASARTIAAVHVDSVDAEDEVSAARAVWVDAENGDPAASAVIERCLDHELGWFATQEIGDLLEP